MNLPKKIAIKEETVAYSQINQPKSNRSQKVDDEFQEEMAMSVIDEVAEVDMLLNAIEMGEEIADINNGGADENPAIIYADLDPSASATPTNNIFIGKSKMSNQNEQPQHFSKINNESQSLNGMGAIGVSALSSIKQKMHQKDLATSRPKSGSLSQSL